MATLGIDFGTSNTAAGVMTAQGPQVLPLAGGESTMPTAVFLDFNSGRMVFGQDAAQAMIDGRDGRFMRSLKSILGTPLAHEKRQFLNEKLTLIEIIARFLSEIRARAEAATGEQYDSVISGRPVRFHSKSEERNAKAATDLQEAYEIAGFKAVRFLPEPEAAALATGGTGRLLIVDIGGGTSDFTVCDRDTSGTTVLASQGIRLGGTDFDRILSLNHVMPLFGHGAQIGSEFGSATHTAPRALFNDLTTWEKIAFVYSPVQVREVRRWQRLAPDARLFERLGDVLEMHLGHDLAYAVEDGKIRVNSDQPGDIALGMVERGLSAPLTPADLSHDLKAQAQEIADCAQETLAIAGCQPSSVDRIVYVGGSSLMGLIRGAVESLCPDARPETSEVFTAVAHGLAHAARQ